MKKYFSTLFFVMVFCSSITAHARISCNNDIISVGDSSLDVMVKLNNCGQVLGKETVQEKSQGTFGARTDYYRTHSQTNGGFEVKTRTIEKWYIRVDEGRGNYFCYPLFFESGVLIHIGDYSECR